MFRKKKKYHKCICPSTGIITLLKIHKEKTLNSYGGYPDPSSPSPDSYPSSFGHNPTPLDPSFNNTSLTNESITPSLNTDNPAPNRPNGSVPHHMSEFYSYDHDYDDGGGEIRGPCFIGDTLIRMADGTTKKIEELQVGDEVISVSGSWTEPHPTGSSWTRMETFLWEKDSGWSGSFSDSDISYSTSRVSQIESSSFDMYNQFEMWENDTTKNTWESGYTSNYKIIKSSFGHPFLIRPKYVDGRSGERNDNDNGYLCFKTSNKIGRGDQMYISGSGFVTIKSKKVVEEESVMYTFRCEENYSWIANDIVVRET